VTGISIFSRLENFQSASYCGKAFSNLQISEGLPVSEVLGKGSVFLYMNDHDGACSSSNHPKISKNFKIFVRNHALLPLLRISSSLCWFSGQIS
jgi:hypothetical protein